MLNQTTDADELPMTDTHEAAHAAKLCKCFRASTRRVGMAPELGVGYGAEAQPSPYAASLPSIAPPGSAPDVTAFDSLEAWIGRSPGSRSVWAIDRLNGKWRVGLSYDGERMTAGEARTMAQAVRNAITIADMAGLL